MQWLGDMPSMSDYRIDINKMKITYKWQVGRPRTRWPRRVKE